MKKKQIFFKTPPHPPPSQLVDRWTTKQTLHSSITFLPFYGSNELLYVCTERSCYFLLIFFCGGKKKTICKTDPFFLKSFPSVHYKLVLLHKKRKKNTIYIFVPLIFFFPIPFIKCVFLRLCFCRYANKDTSLHRCGIHGGRSS